MEQLGRYRIFEPVEVSTDFELYRAFSVSGGGLLRPALLEKAAPSAADDADGFIESEARVGERLSHDHVLRVLDFDHDDDGRPFIAFEWVPGISLHTLLEHIRTKGARLDPSAALYVGVGLLSALAHVHERAASDGALLGLVHRAVSPRAVRLGFGGEVKLCRFGRATPGGAAALEGIDLAYASPELARGDAVDHRADVYSAGLVLRELVSGVRTPNKPERGAVPMLASVPGVDPEIAKVIDRALAFDRGERHPSAAVFRDAIARALYGRDPTYGAVRLASVLALLFGDEAEEERARDRAARTELKADSLRSASAIREVSEPSARAPSEARTVFERPPAEAKPVPGVNEAPLVADDDAELEAETWSTSSDGEWNDLVGPAPRAIRAPDEEPSQDSLPTARIPTTTDPEPIEEPAPSRATPGRAAPPSSDQPAPSGQASSAQAEPAPPVSRSPAPFLVPAPKLEAGPPVSVSPAPFVSTPPKSISNPPLAIGTLKSSPAAFTPPITSAPEGPPRVLPSLESPGLPVGRIALALVALSVISLAVFTFASDRNTRLVQRKVREAFVGRKAGGILTVESVPPGAKVVLDDEDTGRTTPLTIENLESEYEHRLELTLDDGETRTTTVSLLAGQRRTVSVMFEGAVVNLAVRTEPSDAEVWIDGTSVALTPATLMIRTGRETKVRVAKVGYQSFERVIVPGRGENIEIELALEMTEEAKTQEAAIQEAIRKAEKER